jgi:hypothetical protein
VRQVGYLQELNRDARSTTHKIVHVILIIYLYHSAVTFWLYLAIFRVNFSAQSDCWCVETYQNPSHMHCTTGTSAELVAATIYSWICAIYCNNAAMEIWSLTKT